MDLFNELKMEARSRKLLLNPTVLLCDFELAAINALEFHFPNATIKGCFFHFGQAFVESFQHDWTSYEQQPRVV
jgi:hypothetical protein